MNPKKRKAEDEDSSDEISDNDGAGEQPSTSDEKVEQDSEETNDKSLDQRENKQIVS